MLLRLSLGVFDIRLCCSPRPTGTGSRCPFTRAARTTARTDTSHRPSPDLPPAFGARRDAARLALLLHAHWSPRVALTRSSPPDRFGAGEGDPHQPISGHGCVPGSARIRTAQGLGRESGRLSSGEPPAAQRLSGGRCTLLHGHHPAPQEPPWCHPQVGRDQVERVFFESIHFVLRVARLILVYGYEGGGR